MRLCDSTGTPYNHGVIVEAEFGRHHQPSRNFLVSFRPSSYPRWLTLDFQKVSADRFRQVLQSTTKPSGMLAQAFQSPDSCLSCHSPSLVKASTLQMLPLFGEGTQLSSWSFLREERRTGDRSSLRGVEHKGETALSVQGGCYLHTSNYPGFLVISSDGAVNVKRRPSSPVKQHIRSSTTCWDPIGTLQSQAPAQQVTAGKTP